MGKVNFTTENKSRLEELATKFLFGNLPIQGPIGTSMRVEDLLHNTSVNSLVSMNSHLKKQIASMSDLDEWSCTDADTWKLERLKETQELVSLVIGYKKWLAEQEEIADKKAALAAQIDSLKESQKTPAERIAELETQLANL
jgi:hypothetical protein